FGGDDGTKAFGTIDFRTGLTGTPTLVIRATDGVGRANLFMGRDNTGSTTVPTLVTLDVTAGSIDALFGSMLLGDLVTGNSAATGNFKMGAGTLDATSLVLGRNEGSTSTTAGIVGAGTFDLTGGTVTVGTITMADLA